VAGGEQPQTLLPHQGKVTRIAAELGLRYDSILMVITSAAEATGTRTGLRPIDLHTDLRPIADLIDEAFADELDASGRASLREMRSLARMGPLLYLMLPSGSDMGGFFRGFVWESGGQIVGNVTLQQLDEQGKRWMIANVAVRQSYRGQGIARTLMEAALDRIRQLGGDWVLLQVRQDNAVACGLYERMGFAELVAETHLHAPAVPSLPRQPLPPGAEIFALYDGDRSAMQSLWRQAVPEVVRTWGVRRPNDLHQYSDSTVAQWWGRLTGQGYRQRLGLWVDHSLMGVLDIDFKRRGEHRLNVLLHPQLAGQWDAPLLAHGLVRLRAQPDHPVSAVLYDYQPDAVTAMQDFGFRRTTVLVTMRRRMRHLTETDSDKRV